MLIGISVLSFLCGVLLRSIQEIPQTVLWITLGCSIGIFLFWLFFRRRIFVYSACGLFCIGLGALYLSFVDARQPKDVFDDFLETEVSFEGVIVHEPDRRENSQMITVSFDEVKVLVSTELYPEFSYGDKVFVEGTLTKPKNFITDAGKEFDYIQYLGKDGIFYTVSFADVSLISAGHGNSVKMFLYTVKKKFLGILGRLFESPQSSLLSGLLLGTKQSLGDELEESFIRTGLIHIVVLSGYNVTIIAEAIMRMLGFLPLVASVTVGSFSIALFAIMTGAGATIVRASIMAILALIARATGNAFSITRALMLAALLMVLQNPYILYFDISFQLSFLATLGLIYVSPRMEKYLKWIPDRYGIRSIASATLATQIFVLPFLLYTMGTLSLIAPLTNILVLPLIPGTMLFGFLAGVVGFISQVFAVPFVFVAHILLSVEIGIVQFFSRLSFASVSIRHIPLILVFVLYLGIFWFMYKRTTINHHE